MPKPTAKPSTPASTAAIEAARNIVTIKAELSELYPLLEAAGKQLREAAGTDVIVTTPEGHRVVVQDLFATADKVFKTTCVERYSIVVQPAPR